MNLDCHRCLAGSLTTAAAISESSSPFKFVSVWGHNFDKIMIDIQMLMTSPENLLIDMDAKFCVQDGPWRQWTELHSSEVGYSDMRLSVHNGDLIQVGFVIAKNWSSTI